MFGLEGGTFVQMITVNKNAIWFEHKEEVKRTEFTISCNVSALTNTHVVVIFLKALSTRKNELEEEEEAI